MEITLNKNDLYDLMKQAVRDVIQEQKTNLILQNLLTVTEEEMKDINNTYGKPDPNEEYTLHKSINT